jgi:hypothetical protein
MKNKLTEKELKKYSKTTLRKAGLIYMRGYFTGADYTLEDWFNAREYVQTYRKHIDSSRGTFIVN